MSSSVSVVLSRIGIFYSVAWMSYLLIEIVLKDTALHTLFPQIIFFIASCVFYFLIIRLQQHSKLVGLFAGFLLIGGCLIYVLY
ncbi:hypothetical protein EV213_102143 [Aureibacillus halotolerans]|uniref:Uncharacterized protein n=1 Tax=Aureibacillus halotolerans TaxID=1508390 RepID=A0A4R6UAN3_9BACI|nr:hypothetical protein EV213_102143 [Aureibacillus halotolerans]